jgi:hypothetical protein
MQCHKTLERKATLPAYNPVCMICRRYWPSFRQQSDSTTINSTMSVLTVRDVVIYSFNINLSMYLSIYLPIYLSTYLSIYLSIYLCLSIYHLPIHPSSTYLYTMYLCSYTPAWLCAHHLYKYTPITVYYHNYHITLKWWKTNLFFKFCYISTFFFHNKGCGNIPLRDYWNYRPIIRCTTQSITKTASDIWS